MRTAHGGVDRRGHFELLLAVFVTGEPLRDAAAGAQNFVGSEHRAAESVEGGQSFPLIMGREDELA